MKEQKCCDEQKLSADVLNALGFSKTMSTYISEQSLSKRKRIELIENAPVALTEKKILLAEIAEEEDLYLEMLNRAEKLLPGEENHEEEFISVWNRSATRLVSEYDKALKELRLQDGEFFWLNECWFDYDYLDGNRSEGRAFQTLEAALQDIRSMLRDEEWDEYTTCWTELTKWTPGKDGTMLKRYRYFLIRDEIVYFRKANWLRGLKEEPFEFSMSVKDVVLPTPFRPGDIVTLNVHPFGPPIHAVLLQTEPAWECCSFRGLYLGLDDKWHDKAICHRHGWDDVSGYEPMLSPMYRLSLCREEELLPEEKNVLLAASRYMDASLERGKALDKEFFFKNGMSTDELLDTIGKL